MADFDKGRPEFYKVLSCGGGERAYDGLVTESACGDVADNAGDEGRGGGGEFEVARVEFRGARLPVGLEGVAVIL